MLVTRRWQGLRCLMVRTLRALAWTCVLFDNVRAVSDAAAAERAATVCSVLDGSVTVGLHMDFLYR